MFKTLSTSSKNNQSERNQNTKVFNELLKSIMGIETNNLTVNVQSFNGFDINKEYNFNDE